MLTSLGSEQDLLTHRGIRVVCAARRWLSLTSCKPQEAAMGYRVTGLSPEPFRHLFGLPEAELAVHGVKRYLVDKTPGYPDRIEMRDCAPGETVLLLNHVCQTADTPYRASHAIFVAEGAKAVYDAIDQLPDVMRTRLLSVRGFSSDGMMLDADVVEGRDLEPLIQRFFGNDQIAYLHVHNAKRGCFSGRIDRA
ncbi:MAG: DUF1203 domain-containing protein [Bosea sp. (in: a-proteobacteria)]